MRVNLICFNPLILPNNYIDINDMWAICAQKIVISKQCRIQGGGGGGRGHDPPLTILRKKIIKKSLSFQIMKITDFKSTREHM